MDDALSAHNPLQRRSRAATLAQQFDKFRCETPRCGEASARSIDEPKRALDRTAEPDRLVQHGLKYRCEIARRAVDDLEDLGRGRLLVARLAQLGGQPSNR